MYKIRYELLTGKVNLITNSRAEIPVVGHAYMEIAEYPKYDDVSQHLYIIDGAIAAIDLPKEAISDSDDISL